MASYETVVLGSGGADSTPHIVARIVMNSLLCINYSFAKANAREMVQEMVRCKYE